MWAHSLDTDQGVMGGDLTIEVEGEALSGSITVVERGLSESLDDVTFDAGELTFAFDTEFGVAEVAMTLEDGAFSGSLDLPGADAYGLYMSAKRKAGSEQ
ncbi:MAG: hypothetical protein CL476_12860 [Acidobacteria bacterium]|nr:hypothetical protein [Acidobacteriota bacterium]